MNLPERHGSESPVRVAGQIAALAGVYFVTAKFGLMMDAVSGFASLVWPPTGISLATLLLFGRRLWPGVFIGAFSVNLLAGASVPVSLGIGLGNTLEAIAATYALRRIPGFDGSLSRLRDVVGLLGLAAVASTALSATIGTTSLYLGGVVPAPRWVETCTAWWLGDAIGDLVIAPLLLTWFTAGWRIDPLIRRRAWEALILVLALLLVSGAVFTLPIVFEASLYFPVLIWVSLRFGQRTITTIIFVVVGIAVSGTALGRGPFVEATLADGLLKLQAFTSVTAAAFLAMGAVMAERRRLVVELRQRERDLQASVAEARAAIAARDEFLSIAAHELRTPLAALVLHLDGMRNLLRHSPESKQGQKLKAASKATQRLTTLVDNLLDVSRIATGHLSLDCERLDLVTTAREVVERMREGARQAGCELEYSGEGAVVGHWDRQRLEQVLENLISNAIKYGQGKPVEVVVAGTEARGTIAVRDQGIGISEADLARVFGRFERAVSARNYGGLGLGLYISQRLVDAHGGTIRGARREGGGTVFVVELPTRGPQHEVTPT